MLPSYQVDSVSQSHSLNKRTNIHLDDIERAFNLRQDTARASDLENEEKAIANLTAQEYDALRVLNALPEASDLYKFKFD